MYNPFMPVFLAILIASLIASAPVLATPEGQAPTPSSSSIEFDSAENGKIRFRVPPGIAAEEILKADLHDLKYLGPIKPAQGLPWFLFSGRACRDCSQELAIHLVRPTATGAAKPKQHSFVYPGRIIDSKTGQMILDSRAFFGKCLSRVSGEVYVVFQREFIDRRRGYQSSVFVAEPTSDGIEELLIERRLPSVKDALARVKAKTCREVSGRYRTMLRKRLDLRTRAERAADEDDDVEDRNDQRGDEPTDRVLPNP